MNLSLTFDDVQIRPRYSTIESRNTVSVRTDFTRNYKIDVPLVAAPMDTVCDFQMADALRSIGGVGVIHRFCDITTQCIQIDRLYTSNASIRAAAIGVNGDSEVRAERLIEAGANVLLIDVAHGHHANVKFMMQYLISLKDKGYTFDIIAGSIATEMAAIELQQWGADALRVGVGGGSVCETRIRTGIGIPQWQSVKEVSLVSDVPVISDGGIRYPGDAAKALAVGADTVMIGSLFAGTDEAPGEIIVGGKWPNNKNYKMYRGLASATTKMKYKGAAEHVEGASKIIECKGPVSNIVNDIMDGIKSSMSYVGAYNLDEFRNRAEFIQITSSGLMEAHPHLLHEK